MNGWKRMAWTVGLVFVVAAATQFLSAGGDVFHTSLDAWQVVINSGIAAVLALVINAASPWIKQYGVGSK